MKLLGKEIILKTIENIYINEAHPEYQNIIVTDKNRGYVKIFNNGRWKTNDVKIINSVLDGIIEHSKMILDELNLTTDDIKKLRKLPVEKIIDAFVEAQMKSYQTGVDMDFRPWINNENLPQHPIKAIEEGYARDIELIIGTNLDEWKFWRVFEPDFETYEQTKMKERMALVMRMDGEEEATLDTIINTYTESRGKKYSPMNLQEIYDMYMTDSVFRIPSIKFAEAHSKHQENTYMYLFSWRSKLGSIHGLDIPFVFNTSAFISLKRTHRRHDNPD